MSDGEDEVTEMQPLDDKKEKAIAQISKEELERRALENMPVIADSEISPAAHLFANHDEQDDLNLFE